MKMVGAAKAASKRQRERKPNADWMPARRLFTVDEYDRMIAAGIVVEGEHVELVEGAIVQMAPMGGPHIWCIIRLTTWFGVRIAGRALISVQCPVRLAPWSAPEPDLALLRPEAGADTRTQPGPDDVLLVIEVSDTTLAYDRGVKLAMYATAGIREVWIVDLTGEQVLVYRSPCDGVYTETTTIGRGDSISPLEFPDLSITVDEILGEASGQVAR